MLVETFMLFCLFSSRTSVDAIIFFYQYLLLKFVKKQDQFEWFFFLITIFGIYVILNLWMRMKIYEKLWIFF